MMRDPIKMQLYHSMNTEDGLILSSAGASYLVMDNPEGENVKLRHIAEHWTYQHRYKNFKYKT